jgi:hypothetical protein
MRNTTFFLVMLAGCATASTATQPLAIGDGQIDGRKISGYELQWQQCALTDGNWVDGGMITEQVTVIGDQILRLRQIAERQGGPTTVATTYFERDTFGPRRMEIVAIMPDASRKLLAVQELNSDGYHGWSALGGARQNVQGKINSKMMHGGAMGLPLATLGYQESPVEFAASMMNFDATYRVIASWVGRETIDYNGQKIEALLVDLEWHHHESGDVYPPGPDASGGRYWLVPNPPEGFPNVPRYQTDTYAVEFLRGVCPESEAAATAASQP